MVSELCYWLSGIKQTELIQGSFSIIKPIIRGSRLEVFCKKLFLEISQNSQENACAKVSFLIKLQVQAWASSCIKKETQAQVFSCEFCEISKNTFFYRTPLVAASVL